MSKVFSAKRKTVEFTYEFLDGEQQELVVHSLSTKEQKEVSKLLAKKSGDIADTFEIILNKQLSKNDADTVVTVISEQYEEGDIVEFSNSLSALINDEKAKK